MSDKFFGFLPAQLLNFLLKQQGCKLHHFYLDAVGFPHHPSCEFLETLESSGLKREEPLLGPIRICWPTAACRRTKPVLDIRHEL